MKRSVVLALVGLGVAAGATATAHAQGGIIIRNYQGAFNEVFWGPGQGPRAGQGVLAAEGVTLTLWYGEGVLASDQLLLTQVLNWDLGPEGNGYPGYYGPTTVVLPGWSSGETWTFQVRATGANIDTGLSRSALWQESTSIGDISGNPPGPPGVSANSIGFAVFIPEPSTFALAGLGALAALMNFRRRS